MKRTLLLVFIHGFKGGDHTFGNFPAQLRALVNHALPNIIVLTLTYPKYETRGDLKECVSRFREWLQDKVIDLEVANQTPSPTIDPSVHVILVGHSMGGIVGAETLLLVAGEQPLPAASSASEVQEGGNVKPLPSGFTSFMFPNIRGLLAFDTPFLGIAPGVISHGAEEHYKTATNAYSALSGVTGMFGIRGAKNPPTTTSTGVPKGSPAMALPAATSGTAPANAAAVPSGKNWGRYAMLAGAASAVAVGGVALYSQRERLTAGWGWATSHLEFVGCLARPEELRKRVLALVDLHKECAIRSANFYTCLSQNSVTAPENTLHKSSLSVGTLQAKNRTFCYLPEGIDGCGYGPTSQSGLKWIKAVNAKASDEIKAHVGMFSMQENAAFPALIHDACEILVTWVDDGWYASSAKDANSADISSIVLNK